MKTCSNCKVEKEIIEFYVRRLTNGHMTICKSCSSTLAKDRYEKNREHIKEINTAWRNGNVSANKERNRKYRLENREKIKESNRQYYLKNRDERKKANHICYQKNAEKVIKKNAKWKVDNPHRASEIRLKAGAKIRSTVKGNLNNCMSSAIWKSLKGSKCGNRWETLVGYNAEDLKTHLEKLFSLEMNWDNYGSLWEIDHKIPKSIFHYNTPRDIDFQRAWALNNLQPLIKTANRRKYNKIEKPFQPALIGCYE